MPPAAAESRATKAGKWLLAAVIPGSALAIGSLPTEVLVGMSFLASVSCGLLWIDRDARTSRASRWVLIALALLLGMTILQAVPLPSSWSTALSPATSDIWDRALTPLREAGPAWHPLSIAPPATRVQVLRGFFYGCVFLASIRVATLEHGERFLVRVVVASTTLMAVTALAHTAVSAERVFGVYRPREAWAYGQGRLSPLLNTNHLAAYLVVGACVSLGALLSRRFMPRALSGSTLLVLSATSLWQGSRGATGALLFGLVLTFALTLYSKRRFESARVEGAILAACAVAATVIVTISLSEASSHLVSRDFSKVDAARRSFELVGASPWFGFGRGGFETVFSSVRQTTNYMTWTNPEDLVIQWLVEWGVPVTVGGIAVLGWALRPQVVLRAVRPAIGAWVAIVATVLHELVDYHLEVPGIAALVAVCAAIVASGRPTSRESGTTAAGSTARLAAFAVVVGTLAATAVVWPDLGHTLAEDRRKLSAEAADKTVAPEQFRNDVRAAMLRYPAEPFLPLMGAVHAQVTEIGSVLPWTARALERNPRFGRAHFVLARSLAVGHAAQARLEYRLAYENDEALRDAIVKEALKIVDDPSSALELVPDGAAGVEMLDALVAALAPRFPSTAVILDEEIERRTPTAMGPLRRRTDALVTDATATAPWCAGDGCMQTALAAAEELARREPESCAPHVLVARLRIKKKEAAEALDGLEKAMTNVADRASCERQLITLSFESGQPLRGERALDQIVRSGCGAAAECLDLYSWAADMELGRGHYVRAVRLYRRILDLAPDREDLLERIGELGDKEGLLADALEAYGSLETLHPSDPRWPARSAELRSRGSRRPVVPSVP